MRDDPDLPDRPRVRDDAVFRPLAGEWVVFDPEGRQLHVMNLTAALVWSFSDGARTRDDIVREVREAFPEPPDPKLVEKDVDEALDTFREKGLLEGSGRGSEAPSSERGAERGADRGPDADGDEP